MAKREEYGLSEQGVVGYSKGFPPFNHNPEYGEILLLENGDTDPNHKGMKVKDVYLCGIHREIYSWLEERGCYLK